MERKIELENGVFQVLPEYEQYFIRQDKEINELSFRSAQKDSDNINPAIW